METLKDKIIVQLKMESYLSDRELTDRIFGTGQPQQPVNLACRELEKKNIIRRTLRPIKNYLSNINTGFQNGAAEAMNGEWNSVSDNLSEEAIKQIVNNKLLADGWQTEIAWGKTHGADVVAKNGNQKRIIEIKGYGSRYAMRVNYTFKAELINRFNFRTDEELAHAVSEYAYVWYNQVRPHSYNDYRTTYEARYGLNQFRQLRYKNAFPLQSA